MPVQAVAGGAQRRIVGQDRKRLVVQAVICLAVVILLADAVADVDAVVGIDGDQALVEQLVEVHPQQHAVGDFMGAALGERIDVGGLQDLERVFTGNRAAALVCVGDEHLERALPQARLDQGRGAIAGFRGDRGAQGAGRQDQAILGGRGQRVLQSHGGNDPVPQDAAVTGFGVIALADHDVAGKALRVGDPVGGRQEERIGQDRAADLVVGPGGTTQAPDAGDHFREGPAAVAVAEGVPDHAGLQAGKGHEEAAAHDGVDRVFQLEQEGHADRGAGEGRAAAGLPEVDLVGAQAGKLVEPVAIGDANPVLHNGKTP